MSQFGQFLRRLRFNERWMLLSFLVVAVALPTIFFLFFLRRSLLSETELARSTTTATFMTRLTETHEALAEYLANHEALHIPSEDSALSPGERFARAVRRGTADAVFFLAPEGDVLYPSLPRSRRAALLSEQDRQALQIREELRTSLNPQTKWNRVLLEGHELAGARDTSGRFVIPSLHLEALLSANLNEADRRSVESNLAARLLDYRTPLMPSSQRLFLTQELRKMNSDFSLPTLEAERLAVQLLQMPFPKMTSGVLARPQTVLPDGWLLLSQDQTVLVYFNHGRISRELEEIARKHLAGHGLDVRLTLVSEQRPSDVVPHPAGRSLPGWEVQMYRTPDAEREAGRQRTQRFIAVGAGVVALIGLVGFFSIRRYLTISRTTELRHDFLSTVSHELKTPLTSIRLLVETLGAGQWANPERTKQYTEVMQREITRLSHLVESFLTYTRLERGKLKFEFAETDPAHIAEHAVAIIGARFRGNCDFIVDVAPDLPLLVADSDTLITAVLNLLDNAYKYSNERKRITFRVYADDNNVYFSVGDNGIGLSPADCRRVLQRYYRVDSEATRGIGGAGLGLSITKNVAEAHGGELTVRSELGKGSCFTIRVPMHNPKKT